MVSYLIPLFAVAPSALTSIENSITGFVINVNESNGGKRICICLDHAREGSKVVRCSSKGDVSVIMPDKHSTPPP